MTRGYTKEARQQARDAHLDAILPQLVIDGNRIYLEQKLEFGGSIRVDATGLYNFLKEMFTTDWKKELNRKKL